MSFFQRFLLGALAFVLLSLAVPPRLAHAQCALESLCANTCCPNNQLCHRGQCIPRGAACQQHSDCAASAFCSKSLSVCVPRTTTNAQCTYRPPIGQFSPTPLWEWSSSPNLPNFSNVMMSPMVMAMQDTNNDGKIDHLDIPTVVFTSYISGGSLAEEGVVRALRGDTGQEIFTISTAGQRVNGLGSIALGDIDNDGLPDIVAPRFAGTGVSASGLYAFSNTGQLKWTSRYANGQIANLQVSWGGPSIADLDGDGNPEVVLGNAVIRGSDGVVLCEGTGGNGSTDQRRPLSVVADLDGDNIQEIVTGSTAYRNNCATMWTNGAADGFPAVADLNGDGKPEVIVIASGTLRVHNGQTGVLIMSVAIPGGGGGPPTVGDFNGDGKPDIATAGRDYYVVYTTNFTTNQLSLLWQFKTQDHSSAVTGSSVFDFEGDGKAEAVYNDELFMRVFNGQNGQVLYSTANRSATTFEYPVIVDVNNDDRAEIVFCSNNGTMPRLRVFRDTMDNWVDTRNVWNQHAYNITNICTGPTDPFCPPGHRFGQPPRQPLKNWTTPGLNNFRQNNQGQGVFNAADLMMSDLRFSCDTAPGGFKAAIWLWNQGSKRMPAQIPVSIYQGDPNGNKQRLAIIITTDPIDPGEGLFLTTSIMPVANLPRQIFVVADDDGTGKSTRNECDKNNNQLSAPLPNNTEICDGLDNNCDGQIDEAFPTKGQPCTVGTGACRANGVFVCRPDGSGVECSGAALPPSPEICDGLDNDCNGLIDDNLTRSCQNACGSGFEICQAGAWTACTARQPAPETCNNLDDDCDGQIDNGLTRPCSTACGSGNERCVAGQWVFCDATQPKPEECNGLDDDCDGQIDNGLAPKPCTGACGEGTATCVNGAWGGCSGPQPKAEECNGRDDDCDGMIDNGLTRTCRTACGEGTESCSAGAWGACTAPQPSNEICDGKDNDCDGVIDNEGTNPLCPAGLVCHQGECRQRCRGNECPQGLRCENDICMGDPCKVVQCPADKRCVAGQCIEACYLVTCPQGEECVAQGDQTRCLPKGAEWPSQEGNDEAPSPDASTEGHHHEASTEMPPTENSNNEQGGNTEDTQETGSQSEQITKEAGSGGGGQHNDEDGSDRRYQAVGCSCSLPAAPSDLSLLIALFLLLAFARRRA